MSQYKKDEIKEAIEKAALELFYTNGYIQTKIQDIADKSQVSVGNIYRYFSSKNDIFHAIITDSFVSSLKNILIKRTIILHKEQFGIILSDEEKNWYNNKYFDYLISNKRELTILYMYSQGKEYEKIENELISCMLEVKKNILKESNNIVISDDYLNIVVLVIGSNIKLNIKILSQEIKPEKMTQFLRNVDYYHLKGMSALWNKMIIG